MGSNSDERADSMDRIISYRCFVYERCIAVGNWLMFVGEVNKDDRMDFVFCNGGKHFKVIYGGY